MGPHLDQGRLDVLFLCSLLKLWSLLAWKKDLRDSLDLLSLFPKWQHWVNLLPLLSTINLALLIGLLKTADQAWLGAQVMHTCPLPPPPPNSDGNSTNVCSLTHLWLLAPPLFSLPHLVSSFILGHRPKSESSLHKDHKASQCSNLSGRRIRLMRLLLLEY